MKKENLNSKLRRAGQVVEALVSTCNATTHDNVYGMLHPWVSFSFVAGCVWYVGVHSVPYNIYITFTVNMRTGAAAGAGSKCTS